MSCLSQAPVGVGSGAYDGVGGRGSGCGGERMLSACARLGHEDAPSPLPPGRAPSSSRPLPPAPPRLLSSPRALPLPPSSPASVLVPWASAMLSDSASASASSSERPSMPASCACEYATVRSLISRNSEEKPRPPLPLLRRASNSLSSSASRSCASGSSGSRTSTSRPRSAERTNSTLSACAARRAARELGRSSPELPLPDAVGLSLKLPPSSVPATRLAW